MKLPLLVSVLLIVSFADEGFIKPVNGQKVITEDFIKIKDCSTSDDKTRMILNISNIERGKFATLVIHLDLKEEITSGQISVKVNYEQMPIVDLNMDFCDVLSLINKQCPLQSGDFTLKFHRIIPGFTPSGNYETNIRLTDQYGKELGCVNGTGFLK